MSDSGDSVRSFFAWALMILGGLIALLSGGCTLIFLGVGAADFMKGSWGENLSIIIAVLIFGGIPFLVGAALFVGGRALKPRQAQGEGD